MWADAETNTDFLNYSELAEVVALMVADPKLLPLSVLISGKWGTGKSSLLQMIEAKLPDAMKAANGEAAARKLIVVHHDAWRYQGYDDARSALMDRIGKRLLKEAADNATWRDKSVSLFRRVNKLRLLGLLGKLGMAAIGMPGPAVATALEAAGHVIEGKGSAADAAALKDAAGGIATEGKGLLRPEEKATPPEQIDAFRDEFDALLKEMNAILVVFVDNLDRCLPTDVIHTLEALRLFLFMGNSAFVVAADEDMVRGSVARHFEGVEGDHVRDYLDKLLQVPVRVPRCGVPEMVAYLMLLYAEAEETVPKAEFDELRQTLLTRMPSAPVKGMPSAKEAAAIIATPPQQQHVQMFELAIRMAPLLAGASKVVGNPRITKRLLNTIRLRARLAKVRGTPVDETVLAKLALFERCMDEKESERLYLDVLGSADGRSPLLAKLEGGQNISELPVEWTSRLSDFLKNWAELQPPLADLDLRSACLLSRDTAAFLGNRRLLSQATAEALAAIKIVAKLPAPSAEKVAAGIPVEERVDAFEALAGDVGRQSDWSGPPLGFYGLSIIAKLDPSLGVRLVELLKSKAGANTPPWMRPYLDKSKQK